MIKILIDEKQYKKKSPLFICHPDLPCGHAVSGHGNGMLNVMFQCGRELPGSQKLAEWLPQHFL